MNYLWVGIKEIERAELYHGDVVPLCILEIGEELSRNGSSYQCFKRYLLQQRHTSIAVSKQNYQSFEKCHIRPKSTNGKTTY